MKIIHICISERYVEGDSYHENILPTIHQSMGHSVTVIASQSYFDGRTKCMKFRDTADYYNKDGLHVIILPLYKGNRIIGLLGKSVEGLFEKLNQLSPDVIFVHGLGAPDNHAIVKYLKNNNSVKLYADNHNDYHVTPLRKGLKPWIYRRILSLNARVLVPYTTTFWGTLPLRAIYMNKVYGIPKKKIGVLVMGGDDRLIVGKDKSIIRSTVRDKYGIPLDSFLVVTGGAFDKRKQLDLLMDAVNGLHEDNVYLLAFGEPVSGMESVFEKYKKVDNIKLIGWIPSDLAYDMFLASDLAFFPGWHSVLWEQAVACGLPLVVKYWYGVDHVNYNGNALLLRDVTISTIKEAITKLRFTPDYYKILDMAKEAATNFYMSNIANKAIGL